MSVFGPNIAGPDVEQAVLEHLQLWSPTYIAELERLLERDPQSLPQIASWTTTPRAPEKWPEDQLPALLVVSPGIVGKPVRAGDGTFSAKWSIGVAVILSADTEENTGDFAKRYFAAHRQILIQHPSISGFAKDTTWMSEDYDQIDANNRRTLASGYGVFEVEVDGIASSRAGLTEPPEDPYDVPDFPTVESIDTEVEPA